MPRPAAGRRRARRACGEHAASMRGWGRGCGGRAAADSCREQSNLPCMTAGGVEGNTQGAATHMTCLGLLSRVHRTLVLYGVDTYCCCLCCLGCVSNRHAYVSLSGIDDDEQRLGYKCHTDHHPQWVARALENDRHSIPACSFRLTVGERLSSAHAPMLVEGKRCIVM